jgi:metal-responsive CopG/Arc/MetJ family transcriptional regulator
MATATVSIPFQEDLLQQMDEFVVREVRSRAELITTATKMYLNRKQNWQNLFAYGESCAAKNNFTEDDVMAEIKKYRSEK